MEFSIFTAEAVVFMLAASIALMVWFLRSEAALSLGRMTRMMARFGLDTGLFKSNDPETRTLMSNSRARCKKCPHEARCERWLAGEIGGDTSFCPNNRVFLSLK